MTRTSGATVPANIALIGTELAMSWEDGHESFYPMAMLREHCPCALCKSRDQEAEKRDASAEGRAEAGNPLKMLPPEAAARISASILRYEIVGRYAVRFIWSDRHDSGIYDFRLLRGLCPCAECVAKNEES